MNVFRLKFSSGIHFIFYFSLVCIFVTLLCIPVSGSLYLSAFLAALFISLWRCQVDKKTIDIFFWCSYFHCNNNVSIGYMQIKSYCNSKWFHWNFSIKLRFIGLKNCLFSLFFLKWLFHSSCSLLTGLFFLISPSSLLLVHLIDADYESLFFS